MKLDDLLKENISLKRFLLKIHQQATRRLRACDNKEYLERDLRFIELLAENALGLNQKGEE